MLLGRLALCRPFMHEFVVLRSVDHQISGKPTLGARQGVIDEDILAAAIDLEVDDGGSSWRHGDRLHIVTGGEVTLPSM